MKEIYKEINKKMQFYLEFANMDKIFYHAMDNFIS